MWKSRSRQRLSTSDVVLSDRYLVALCTDAYQALADKLCTAPVGHGRFLAAMMRWEQQRRPWFDALRFLPVMTLRKTSDET
jgi:hypothetical protein